MEPGRHEGIPAAEYHAADGLGSTAIRTAATYSVAHYLAIEQTPAMRKGSIHHAAVLEPERFQTEFMVAPQAPCPRCPSGRMSMVGATHCHQHGGREESREWHDALPDGAEVVTQQERDEAARMADAVRAGVARSDTPGLLTGGAREVSYCAWAVLDDSKYSGYRLTTEDPGAGGILTRARVDIEHPGLAVDLKGVSSLAALEPRKWAWRMRDYGLLLQAALYVGIINAVTGSPPEWGWLVHQSVPPYATRLFVADPMDLLEATQVIAEGLRRWRAYHATGDQWVGWPTHRQVVSIGGEL